ncbi:MAG: TetR/AcrR family transcriptional regulator, partial [Vallitaleaceae bacterium]|nr:TetR/AcrR family transcriptional regulator [Vallitaleaceae bacterium]
MDVTLMIRKESIVLTAIDLMNEFGVQALSTKEIAKREGISEGAVFKHYPRKSDLVLAVLDYFSKYDKDIYEAIEKRGLKPKEAIAYVIDAYATYYQGYPAITAITQAYDEMRYSPVLVGKIDAILRTRLDAFRKLVE